MPGNPEGSNRQGRGGRLGLFCHSPVADMQCDLGALWQPQSPNPPSSSTSLCLSPFDVDDAEDELPEPPPPPPPPAAAPPPPEPEAPAAFDEPAPPPPMAPATPCRPIRDVDWPAPMLPRMGLLLMLLQLLMLPMWLMLLMLLMWLMLLPLGLGLLLLIVSVPLP